MSEEKISRCIHGVWSADHCYKCEVESAPPKPEERRHARIDCAGKKCGEYNCDSCYPPKPEAAQLEWNGQGNPNNADNWVVPSPAATTQPKPAPQAEGFEEWFTDERADKYQYGAEGAARDAWSAAQVPLLKRIEVLEKRVEDLLWANANHGKNLLEHSKEVVPESSTAPSHH